VFFIYYLSLFYLDFIHFYFLSKTILLQLQVILFQEQIFERLRLGAKERLFGADSGQKYEDFLQKYRHSPCLRRFQRQIPTRKVGTARASNDTAVRDIQTAFCCFCFLYKLPILVSSELRPMVTEANLKAHINVITLRDGKQLEDPVVKTTTTEGEESDNPKSEETLGKSEKSLDSPPFKSKFPFP